MTGSPLGHVLRTAARIAHRDGPGQIVEAIIAAAAECSADEVEADTMAFTAICFLGGHWRTAADGAAPLTRLAEWAAASTPDWLATIVGNAAAEADWLAGIRTTAAELPSPVELAERAKRERDLLGELAALTTGYETLTARPWYPAQPGDILHVHYEAVPGVQPACGETYVVEHSEDEGGLVLRVVHASDSLVGPGAAAPGMVDDPFMEAWMEAGPAALTIVRNGRVVHGDGAR